MGPALAATYLMYSNKSVPSMAASDCLRLNDIEVDLDQVKVGVCAATPWLSNTVQSRRGPSYSCAHFTARKVRVVQRRTCLGAALGRGSILQEVYRSFQLSLTDDGHPLIPSSCS